MNEPWEEAMHDKDGKLIGHATAQGMRYSSSLSTPLLCPFCMWAGVDDNVKMEFEESPSGIHVTGGVKWTCPSCESVVHEEDEGYGTNFIHDHRLRVNGKPVMGPGSDEHNA